TLFDLWEEAVIIHDRKTKQVMRPDNMNSTKHTGKYYQVRGLLTPPKSLQGRPVLMQAGASNPGITLAAEYADAVYSVSWNRRQAREFREKMDQAVLERGERNRYIKIFPGLVTYVGKTRDEALKKKAKLDKLLDTDTILNQLSIFVGQDCSKWDVDKKVPVLPPVEEFSGPVGRYKTILEIIRDKDPTVRELLSYLNAGGGHFTLIGTPEEIVDEMELWFKEGI